MERYRDQAHATLVLRSPLSLYADGGFPHSLEGTQHGPGEVNANGLPEASPGVERWVL